MDRLLDFVRYVPPEALPAITGLLGALVGGGLSYAGQLGAAHFAAKQAEARQRALDAPREKLLRHMLDDGLKRGLKWRKLWRLSQAIGASPEETARLLVAIGARGDISENARDEPQWGYIHAVGQPPINDT